jgi:hypothetical protein
MSPFDSFEAVIYCFVTSQVCTLRAWTHLMTASNNQGPRRSGVESRTQKRRRCRQNSVVRLAIRPSFQNIVALVHDVSESGIGFLLDRPLEEGTSLILQLKGGRRGTSVVRTAKVMHVRPHLPIKEAPWVKKKPLFKVLFSFLSSDDEEEKTPAPSHIYLVGCRLTPPLTEEEIESLCIPMAR